MAEVIGVTSSRDLWTTLERVYSNQSSERTQNLRDSLRQLKKGTSTVSDFAKKFKSLCDQLTAIGYPVDSMDKTHWFLCGLGPAFETFSTAQRAVQPPPSFVDLVSRAEGHELFLVSLHGSAPTVAAFNAQHQPSKGRGSGSGSRGGRGRNSSFSGGRGRGRRPPHCQLCRTNGHYASACPNLATFQQQASNNIDANLARAFQSSCNVSDQNPDWYVDSGATAHMAPSSSHLDHVQPYTGHDRVLFGNGSNDRENSGSRNA